MGWNECSCLLVLYLVDFYTEDVGGSEHIRAKDHHLAVWGEAYVRLEGVVVL